MYTPCWAYESGDAEWSISLYFVVFKLTLVPQVNTKTSLVYFYILIVIIFWLKR